MKCWRRCVNRRVNSPGRSESDEPTLGETLRTIDGVSPTIQALLFALLGAVLGGGAVLAFRVSERQLHAPEVPEPALPPGVAAVLSVLRSSALVVDASDTVLKASAPAIAMGLVRGHEITVRELADLVRQVRRDGQIRETELLMQRPGLPPRHVTARVAPLSSQLVLALVEDRTRERRVESIRRDFVANVSHELKTPVGAIKLLSDAVIDAADDPEAVQRFAGRMHTESERLARLVQQIIELSRLQGDDPLDEPVAVEVDKIIARAIDESATDAAARQIELVQNGTDGLVLLGNREQVAVAVSNLVANAVAYSPEGSTVVVGATGARHRPSTSASPTGHRHPGPRARPDLRALLPRRPGAAPLHRRHRPRPLDRQARRRLPRRRGTGLVGRGPGLDVHPDPAPQARTAARASAREPDSTTRRTRDSRTGRRGRGELQRRPRLHAPQGGLRGGHRRHRPRRARRVRPRRRRHRAARPDAARHPRHRGVPPDPADLQRAGDHGQRQGRRGRQGGRASSSAPTTTSPSPTPRASWSPASAPCSVAASSPTWPR